MSSPLHVAFVWHMHQPYYKLSDSGAFEMPWVRLHAAKDYAEMIDVLLPYEGLRQTFNLVPSLVEQLLEYDSGAYVDTYQEIASAEAGGLTAAEQRFLLGVMCERTTHPRTRRHPRYLELAQKRDRRLAQPPDAREEFTEGEIRDLQVWFDLAWFHPCHTKEGALADLVARGRDFTEDDKMVVRAEQAALLHRVLPAYERAAQSGRIELTTSPYYHPILPLLANSDLARVSLPDVQLPTRRFAHPEDASEQIVRALDLHAQVFGRRPEGMWCSEQSVGEDVIAQLTRHDLRWTVSDESVLSRSCGRQARDPAGGRPGDPDFLYTPYRLDRDEGRVDIVFRDRVLSDLIGFTYRDWAPADAAADLMGRLRRIRDDLSPFPGTHLVTIALDGENAWEYYVGEGREFLDRLYEGLEKDPTLRCLTVSQHLDECPPQATLPWLHTGSWVGGDLGTWMGDRAHRTAWDLLHDARDAVAEVRARNLTPPDIEAAWREILIAEGSDWFWWFSDHQESGLDEIWDAAFRRHLQQAYRLAGITPPAALLAPILGPVPSPTDGRVQPILDGRLTTPEEWAGGIRLAAGGGGAMQRAEDPPVDVCSYGWSEEGLFFLVVPRHPWTLGTVEVVFYVARGGTGPEGDPTAMPPSELGFTPQYSFSLSWRASEEGLLMDSPARSGLTTAFDTVVEAHVPWDIVGASPGGPLFVAAAVFVEGRRVDMYPSTGVRISAP